MKMRVTETASCSGSIPITLEAKENLTKHAFITGFILNSLMTQIHFFCFYTSKLLQSITRWQISLAIHGL